MDNSKRIIKERTKKISDDYHSLTDEGYPKPICLELADLKESIGVEREILEALQSFAFKDRNRRMGLHDLKNKGFEEKFFKPISFGKRSYKFDKVWSIDIGGRTSNRRMIFALDDKRNVVKILSFNHDTHCSR